MGFGGATARLFAREGASVLVTDVNADLGEQTAAEIRAEGGAAAFVVLDVTREDHWLRATDKALQHFGSVDVLVNNAAVARREDVEHTSLDDWELVQRVNSTGSFLDTRAVIGPMKEAGGGAIVNVSSIYGLVGSPHSAAYHASKGAIRSLSRAAAIQLAPHGIRVNTVFPGYALTPMNLPLLDRPDEVKVRLDRVPMGGWIPAASVANAVLYLASDEASWVTGAELAVDGGMTAR